MSVALVAAIGRLADDAGHHPSLDLRAGSVTVRLTSNGIGGLPEQDVALARQISIAAREPGVTTDPSAIQIVEVTIDALDGPAVIPFWRAILGYHEPDDSPDDLIDPRGRGPSRWFQQLDAPRPQRNRVQIDISVPHDQAEARVAAAIAAGGHLVTDRLAPSWWVLPDTEGNEACIAIRVGRD